MTIAALLLATAIVAAGVIGSPPRSRRGAGAVATFLAAWEHKLRGTYVVDATVTRTVASSSGQLVAPLRIVQRPPDRLTYGYGDATGRTKDATLRCPSTPSGASPCFTSPGALSYDDDVAQELATLRTYIEGAKPLYSLVDFRDGCFRADLALQFPAPPWGNQALFCFDAATGAPSLTVIDHGDVVERTVAAAIRPRVDDADLQVPQDRGQLVTEPGVTTTTSTPPTTAVPTSTDEPPTSS